LTFVAHRATKDKCTSGQVVRRNRSPLVFVREAMRIANAVRVEDADGIALASRE